MARQDDDGVTSFLPLLPGADMVRLLVGPSKREFSVDKKLLCASGPFFCHNLEAVANSVPTFPLAKLPPATRARYDPHDHILWLPEDCPHMMEFFVLWLYQPNSFRTLLEQMAISVAGQLKSPLHSPKVRARTPGFHWNLVKLHLFAAAIDLPSLQDIAMDAIQDIYLRCNWDVSINFMRFLYHECSREHSLRLRKWAVAMLAWFLSSGVGDPHVYDELFVESDALSHDYLRHLDKMLNSKANVRVKNPQLRLPRNRLQNEERSFGFRLCSFHTHRAAVGEGRCPYADKYPP